MTPAHAGAVVVVTGGARGIGRAIGEALAGAGAQVALGDIDGQAVLETAGRIPRAVGFELDVADPDSFAGFIDEVEQQLGPIDILVNNAGIMPIGAFEDQDAELARRTMDVNVHGPLNGIRSVLPRMLERGGGQIVNIASTAGKVPTPGTVLYSASKHAVVGLSDAVRQEFGHRGIAVTTVLPSFTNTELIAGTKGLRGVPTIQPEDVARAVVAAVERRQPTAYVPAMVRGSVVLHALLPARANDALSRLYGSDRVFLDYDREARSDYDVRIAEPSRS